MEFRDKLERHNAAIKAGTAKVFKNDEASSAYSGPMDPRFYAKLQRHKAEIKAREEAEQAAAEQPAEDQPPAETKAKGGDETTKPDKPAKGEKSR